jgi:ribosomal protein S18 acetylase RimI-like enzyme
VILEAADDDSTSDMLGLVTVEVRLLDSISKAILNAERSELMLTNAISSLGPKREYKDSSVIDVANALLPPEITAVCSFSNLCVSPNARRRGVARRLCEEAELLGKELGFGEMHLCVESENTAAKALYVKLGYETKFETKGKSLRVDSNAGAFNEVDAEIVIMTKKM